ncbi:hypothetical protein WJX74_003121 [Apatococcus lobatus]|uniref:W2 domain-containing protein n=1 Tax=Apatococcus lobatus TaxID=904363 RepID=A0AAW1Q614_9CHLO
MSSKEEKPTLAGAQIKTRKRNIAVPLDPASFATAVVDIFDDAKEVEGNDQSSLEKNLQAGVKGLDSAELDFSRYGETLFEVLFAGGRMAAGGNVVEEGRHLATSVMNTSPDRATVMSFVKIFQNLVRRRPFLIKALENTLVKLLRSLDFYSPDVWKKLAIATSRIFANKLGVLPDRVLPALLHDRTIAKGTPLDFITEFFQDYLSTEPIDDLVVLLRKARLDERLLDFFPPQKRSLPELDAHFQAAGLKPVVDYTKKKVAEVHLEELKASMTEMLAADPPFPVAELISAAKAKKAEWQLLDADIVKTIWVVLVGTVPTTGKNVQQIKVAMLKTVKTYSKLLNTFANSARAEASLINQVQISCYEDSKMLKVFADIVRILYDQEIAGEDTILYWYKKGSQPKGRQVFQRDLEPFVKWLEEAEEEGDEDDD